jgi:hypothetical protein
MSNEMGEEFDLTPEEREDLDRAWDKYLADIEAKKTATSERRAAQKRAARAAKKAQPE